MKIRIIILTGCISLLSGCNYLNYSCNDSLQDVLFASNDCSSGSSCPADDSPYDYDCDLNGTCDADP